MSFFYALVMDYFRPVPASDERSGGSNGRVVVNGSKDADTGSKRAVGSTPVVYNDNQQVFVGNLPQHLTDQELIDFFAR
jgi:RNA recognition motif-containing protein